MFKTCNKCGYQWHARDDFLKDRTIIPVGYQVFFEDLKHGLFLFNHSCGTTIAVEAEYFLDLYSGGFHDRRVPAKDRKCPGRCLTKNIMSPCSDKCRCAFVSQILQVMKHIKLETAG